MDWIKTKDIRTLNWIVNMYWDKLTEPSIQELFMDFVNIHSTSGLSLSNLLISKLAEYEIPLSDCWGQGYDNGSNMVGEYQGVQSRIRSHNQRAFFAPCAAHKLNLLLTYSFVMFLKVVLELYNFLEWLNVCTLYFQRLQKDGIF